MISIIMSVRNAESYLAECLDSIIGQTERDWELLVVNNHSTDGSAAILRDYQEMDDRIKLFHNSGNGLIEALRMAYAKSSGNFITRMDADDIMPPEKLAVLKSILIEKGPRHVATGKVRYFSEKKLGKGYEKYEQWLNHLMETGENYSQIYRECVIPSPCWMVYRDDFEHCGAFWQNTYPEDYDLCFRFYKHDLIVAASGQILHHWRDYADRASRTDPEYTNSRFLELKTGYFLKLDYEKEKVLVLWGAGSKGKWLARRFQKDGVPFTWVTNNAKKIGADIYGVRLLSFEELVDKTGLQIIISVAGPADQHEIRLILEKMGLIEGEGYYFFC